VPDARCIRVPRLAARSDSAETPSQPGSGFVDPEGIPARPRTADIEPVYRGPAIDTLATIRKRGVLRVGVAAVPPMVMHDSKGALRGFSIDLARKLAEDLGIDVEFLPTSWAQIIPDLVNRNSDVIITGLWITPQRALVVNYTDPTSTEGAYLIANRSLAANMKSKEDFNRSDVRIAAYAGTIQERLIAKHFPQATLVKVEGDALELTPVLEGKAHAVLVPTFAPEVMAKVAPDELFVPLSNPIRETVTGMAVRKRDADFLNYLNSWIRFQHDNGWLDERTEYWAESTDWME
jgi:polar amino acid transport system substrate-binding protein